MKQPAYRPLVTLVRLGAASALAVAAATIAPAQTVIQNAVAFWTFEGNTQDTVAPLRHLTPVASTAAAFDPPASVTYSTVTGLPGLAPGQQAVNFTGAEVLKTSDAAFRIGGSQTFWMRVNFGTVPTSGNVGLIGRTRANNGNRGIALQMVNGRLQGVLSETGQTYNVILNSTYDMLANTWYDVSLTFDAGTSLRIDIFNPVTGLLLSSASQTLNIPTSVSTAGSIAAGYFQISGINAGSSGSSWLLPNGTKVEAAGVWSTALTSEQLASLSAIPEPASAAAALGACALAATALRRRRRRV